MKLPKMPKRLSFPKPRRRPTLLGRAIILIGGEIIANVVVWIAAGICYHQSDGLLGLAVLAWTIGLRHGLDADHISAIDNATRQLVSLGQLPITVGLWFSLGHSTIVIITNIAIAISVDIYDKLDRVGSIGGLIGTSVSASFLFLIALLNTFFLVQTLRTRRRIRALEAQGLPIEQEEVTIQGGGCLVRIISPILKAVDKGWKMYPVGVLFGLGFDTASSIALLAISAIAQRGTNGETINHGKVVILPFLFTAGMSLVDSLDSVLMLYAYASPSRSSEEGKLAFFQAYDRGKSREALPIEQEEEAEIIQPLEREQDSAVPLIESEANISPDTKNPSLLPESPAAELLESQSLPKSPSQSQPQPQPLEPRTGRQKRIIHAKANIMSSLSITLTILSILLALSISLIEIMGLIGDNCTPCREAAEDPNGGGLAGSWWRFWASANDNSGYIGAGIVGVFVVILVGWYGGRWVLGRYRTRGGDVA